MRKAYNRFHASSSHMLAIVVGRRRRRTCSRHIQRAIEQKRRLGAEWKIFTQVSHLMCVGLCAAAVCVWYIHACVAWGVRATNANRARLSHRPKTLLGQSVRWSQVMCGTTQITHRSSLIFRHFSALRASLHRSRSIVRCAALPCVHCARGAQLTEPEKTSIALYLFIFFYRSSNKGLNRIFSWLLWLRGWSIFHILHVKQVAPRRRHLQTIYVHWRYGQYARREWT